MCSGVVGHFLAQKISTNLPLIFVNALAGTAIRVAR